MSTKTKSIAVNAASRRSNNKNRQLSGKKSYLVHIPYPKRHQKTQPPVLGENQIAPRDIEDPDGNSAPYS